MRISVVVVLFNKFMNESRTLQSLLGQNLEFPGFSRTDISINIYDNSLSPCLSFEDVLNIKQIFDVNYIHNKENTPLSVIYSSYFESCNVGDYILFFDDDTSFPPNYLQIVFSTVGSLSNIDDLVMVPKIFVGKKLVSPYKSSFVFSTPIKDSYFGFCNNVSAINSGIVIKKSSLLSNFKYPKYTTFYGTDSVLFEFFHANNYMIYVFDVLLDHDLSFHPDSAKDKYIVSLSKVISFWASHYKNRKIHYVALIVYLCALSVKLSLKYKEVINLLKYTK